MPTHDYHHALALRATVKTLQSRSHRMRQGSLSMEQAHALLELVGAYAGVTPGSAVVSVESLNTPDGVLDKVDAVLGKMQVTLEWFFSKSKEAKTSKPAPAQTVGEEQMLAHFEKNYSNKAWLGNATLHDKPTHLSGTVGGILSYNEKGLPVDETIRKLTEEIKNVDAFLKQATGIYTKWIKWADGITEAVEAEWEKHKGDDGPIPSITAVVRQLHPHQPVIPSSKFDITKIIVLGTAKDAKWVDKYSDFLIDKLPIPEVKVEFEPLTQDQVAKLADIAQQLYEHSENLHDLEEILTDGSGLVGFDDYPYRADQVRDAIDAFGWNKANWDAHSIFNQTQLISLLEECTFRKFKAIHSWLYNAVVERP